MVDRFSWNPGELIPGDEIEDVEEADVQEGRHSKPWREDMVTRDGEGQFASSGGGGGSSAGGSSSGGGSRGGDSPGSRSSAGASTAASSTSSPGAVTSAAANRRAFVPASAAFDPRTDVLTTTIASEDIPTKNGAITSYRVQGDNDHTYIKTTDRTVVLNDDEITAIQNAVDDPHGQGQDDDSEGADGPLVGPDGTFGAVRTIGKGNRVAVDIDGKPTFELSPKEARALAKAHERLRYARRLTAQGDTVDVIDRGRGVALRTTGEDGKPVEIQLRPSSADRVATAFYDHIDDLEDAPQKVKTEQGVFGFARDTPPGKDPVISITMPNGRVLKFDTEDQQGDFQGALSTAALGESARRDTTSGAEAHALSEHVTLTEAATGTVKGRRFRARLIAGDVQGSSGYYPAAMLRENAAVFRAGLPVYLDHPGITEQHERPERSVRDLAGRLATEAVYERDGLYADVQVYPHWAPVIEAMADDIGMSIRAAGTVEASTRSGIRGPIVTALTEASSVDFVTQAGAGGRIVALLESARKGNLAPPFKKKDEDEDPEDLEDEDDETNEDGDDAKKKGKKGKLPAFLAAKFKAKEADDLAEAATVGSWFESRIHLGFTEMADEMFGGGLLTRDERIGLSSAIGEALTAFNNKVEANHPHLYQRDLWADPVKDANTTTQKGAPMTEGTNTEQAPPERGADVTEAARDRVLAEALAEAKRSAEALTEAQQAASAEIAALKKRLDESDAANRALDNDRAARAAVAEALRTSGLHVLSHARVIESVCRTLPTGEDGRLDTVQLGEAIKTAIDGERTYVAGLAEATGAGIPRGLGESLSPSEPLTESAFETTLVEQFERLGMTPAAAKIAASGRR